MTCLECGVECAEAVQVCVRCAAPVAGPESLAADSAVGMVRSAAGYDASAATAHATGLTLQEPYVPGRGGQFPSGLRRVLRGYSWMAWGAVLGGWAVSMAAAYFENLGDPFDYRYLFPIIAAGMLAAVLFGLQIRWSWFLRRPRDRSNATVAACQRGGRALLLDAPWDGFSSGLVVRLAWWAEPETLLPGESVTYYGRRGGVGRVLVNSSTPGRSFVGAGRRPPGASTGEGTVRGLSHRPGGQRAGPRYLRWGPELIFGLGLVAAVMATLIAFVPPLTGHRSLQQLRPGNCLTGSTLGLGSGSTWPYMVAAVPCTGPHLAEVFFAGDAWPKSPAAYPGDNAIADQGYARCLTAFSAYDGIDNSESAFAIYFISPFDGDWSSGNRLLVCLAYESTSKHPGGVPVDYSVKGSKT